MLINKKIFLIFLLMKIYRVKKDKKSAILSVDLCQKEFLNKTKGKTTIFFDKKASKKLYKAKNGQYVSIVYSL